MHSEHYSNEDHITPSQAMAKLCYKDRESFWKMAKRSGMPFRQLNKRVFRIPRGKFNQWLAAKDSDNAL